MKKLDIFQDKVKYLGKYIWFDREETIKDNPYKIIAYAMRYADVDDYPVLLSLGKDTLIDVLSKAQAGWFDKGSWNFWHNMLKIENIPDLPIRECLENNFDRMQDTIDSIKKILKNDDRDDAYKIEKIKEILREGIQNDNI